MKKERVRPGRLTKLVSLINSNYKTAHDINVCENLTRINLSMSLAKYERVSKIRCKMLDTYFKNSRLEKQISSDILECGKSDLWLRFNKKLTSEITIYNPQNTNNIQLQNYNI